MELLLDAFCASAWLILGFVVAYFDKRKNDLLDSEDQEEIHNRPASQCASDSQAKRLSHLSNFSAFESVDAAINEDGYLNGQNYDGADKPRNQRGKYVSEIHDKSLFKIILRDILTDPYHTYQLGFLAAIAFLFFILKYLTP